MAPGLNVMVTNGVPDMRVRVNTGSSIGYENTALHEGEECVLNGPTALSLQAEGHVTILEEV